MSCSNQKKVFPELKGKRLLLLGGSAWLDIIKAFAEENGIYLISAGNNKNSKIAQVDEYYNVNSIDHDAMKRLISEKQIDGVYLGCNETVIRNALQYLSDINMPCYCNINQWDTLMNKSKFKALCIQFGLPVAKRFAYTPGTPCTVEFPVVVKPADGCGSVAVRICNNEDELRESYINAMERSASKEVIIEECVKNSGMDVFFQVTDSQIEFLALGDKYPVQLAEGAGSVAGARILPSIYTEDFRSRFEEKIISMFKSVGLTQGFIWMEVFHDGDDYYFNEVGYRVNGSLSIIGIDYLCGVNTVAADIYHALTGKGKSRGFSSLITKECDRSKRKVCEFWIASEPGIIGDIRGLDSINNNPNVLGVFPKYGVGDTVPHTDGFAQNFCVIHIAFDSAQELQSVISFIRNNLKLIDVSGNNMIIEKDENFIKNVLNENIH